MNFHEFGFLYLSVFYTYDLQVFVFCSSFLNFFVMTDEIPGQLFDCNLLTVVDNGI